MEEFEVERSPKLKVIESDFLKSSFRTMWTKLFKGVGGWGGKTQAIKKPINRQSRKIVSVAGKI